MRLFVVALICRSISFRLVNAIWRDWPAHVFFVQINKNSNLITVLVLTKLSIVQKKKEILIAVKKQPKLEATKETIVTTTKKRPAIRRLVKQINIYE